MATAAPHLALRRNIGDCCTSSAIAAPHFAFQAQLLATARQLWRLRRNFADRGATLPTAAQLCRPRRLIGATVPPAARFPAKSCRDQAGSRSDPADRSPCPLLYFHCSTNGTRCGISNLCE